MIRFALLFVETKTEKKKERNHLNKNCEGTEMGMIERWISGSAVVKSRQETDHP